MNTARRYSQEVSIGVSNAILPETPALSIRDLRFPGLVGNLCGGVSFLWRGSDFIIRPFTNVFLDRHFRVGQPAHTNKVQKTPEQGASTLLFMDE